MEVAWELVLIPACENRIPHNLKSAFEFKISEVTSIVRRVKEWPLMRRSTQEEVKDGDQNKIRCYNVNTLSVSTVSM